MSLNLKLAVGGALIAAATAYLAWMGASSSWRYYVLVDECLQNQDQLRGQRLRVSGRVAPDTLQIEPDRRSATFSLLGSTGEIAVTCPGPLPDNLAEDMEVVVEGALAEDGAAQIRGDKVLTRCASKYQADGAADRPDEAPSPRTLP